MALDLGTDNGIYISDKAKSKVVQLMNDAGVAGKPDYFAGWRCGWRLQWP